jgi:hypothetical protein
VERERRAECSGRAGGVQVAASRPVRAGATGDALAERDGGKAAGEVDESGMPCERGSECERGRRGESESEGRIQQAQQESDDRHEVNRGRGARRMLTCIKGDRAAPTGRVQKVSVAVLLRQLA